MSTELAMNAYVLLGNALQMFVNGLEAPPESGISPEVVRRLYVHIEPMTPPQIEQGIAALDSEDKAALGVICRYVILQTAPMEASAALGLPPEVIDKTLADLGL